MPVVYSRLEGNQWYDIPPRESAQIENARVKGRYSINITFCASQTTGASSYEVLLEFSLIRALNSSRCLPMVRKDTQHGPDYICPGAMPTPGGYQGYYINLLKHVNSQAELDKCPTCPICLDLFSLDKKSKNKPIRMRECSNHSFHAKCISQWFSEKMECPLCKYDYRAWFGNCPDDAEMRIFWSSTRLERDHDPESRGHWIMECKLPCAANGAPDFKLGGVYEDVKVDLLLVPDTPGCRTVLKLLQIAWDRGLFYDQTISFGEHIEGMTGVWPFRKHLSPDGNCYTFTNWIVEDLASFRVTEDQIESLLDL